MMIHQGEISCLRRPCAAAGCGWRGIRVLPRVHCRLRTDQRSRWHSSDRRNKEVLLRVASSVLESDVQRGEVVSTAVREEKNRSAHGIDCSAKGQERRGETNVCLDSASNDPITPI